MKHLILTVLLAAGMACSAFAADYGVYEKAVEGAKGPFAQVVKTTEDAVTQAGWKVLASYDSGVMSRCGLRAHNIVIDNPEYDNAILGHGAEAAFAIPLRVAVYEDAKGINVTFVNPQSINRTIVGDNAVTALSSETNTALSKAITTAVSGNATKAQLGQVRDEGYVGGMGGGAFSDKLETIHKGGKYQDIVNKVETSINSNKLGWKLVYRLDAPNGKVTVFGVTKPDTEARAFDIAGDKRESSRNVCPGLDHAAAFPIEVVVIDDGSSARVLTMDEMYRMKVYFEDAGNWAFMKNITMPGQIEDEVVEISTSLFK